MLKEKLKNLTIILASGSPRRHYFFNEMDIDFTIDVRKIEEVYPPHLKGEEITNFLSQLKASVFSNISENEIVVTSDTIVWKDGVAIGKPTDFEDAKRMLKELSGKKHQVFTSVCFTGKDFQKTVNDVTDVWFRDISEEEIEYYLNTCKPFDKAGSYGIQDWLGYIGIERLEGCFFNVMGLPTRKVYDTLLQIATEKK